LETLQNFEFFLHLKMVKFKSDFFLFSIFFSSFKYVGQSVQSQSTLLTKNYNLYNLNAAAFSLKYVLKQKVGTKTFVKFSKTTNLSITCLNRTLLPLQLNLDQLNAQNPERFWHKMAKRRAILNKTTPTTLQF